MPEAHLRKPTAEEVRAFAERMKTQWQHQDQLDQAFADLDNMKQIIEVAAKNKPKTFRSGVIGRQSKKEASVLNILPFTHFRPRTEKEPDADHANKLEAWTAGVIQKSQKAGDAWGTVPDKGVRTGRAWVEVIPDPQVWATDEIEALTKSLKDMEGDSREAAAKKLELMKRDGHPILMREVETRGTWTYFSGRVWLPEVIQIRKMTKSEIASTWPDITLPAAHQKKNDSTEIEVFYYTNHKHAITVIPGAKKDNDSAVAHEFEHDLGMNCVQLAEFVRAGENDMNIRWHPSMMHAMEMAEVLDEALSDWRTAQREGTRAQTVVYHDPEAYQEDEKVAGRPPTTMKIEPGGETLHLWTTEKLDRAPAAEMNDQAAYYLNVVLRMIESEVKRPSLEADFKSGTSNNLAMSATQLAERDFDPMVRAIKNLWENISKLHLRSVGRVNREFPSHADKIYVFDPRINGKGEVGIGPDDVIGVESQMIVRAERAIPIDENITAALAARLMGDPIFMDPWTVYEQKLGIEDANAAIERRFRWQALQAVQEQVVIPLALERAIGAQQALSPAEQQEVLELAMGAPPELLQALGMGQNGAAPAAPGQSAAQGNPLGQATANINRTATPQEPQGLGRI